MVNSPWVDEWMRAWRSCPDAGEANPWTAMLEHFAKSHPASQHPCFAESLYKVTEQSRAFFDLGQTLARNGGADWQQAVFHYLDELSRQVQDPQAAANAFGGVSPLDYWRGLAGHGHDPESSQRSLTAQLDQLLRMPGIGHTREHQEALQELSRLWLSYEQAYGEYAAHCAETASRSVARLRDRLQSEFASGGGPASIRALYDAWVVCSEEVHAERVATQDYMKLHGRLVNALMAYRRQAGKLMDEWAKATNMPTREEVDALHRKLKDTRAELRALQTGAGVERTDGKKKRKAAKKSKKKAGKKRATRQ